MQSLDVKRPQLFPQPRSVSLSSNSSKKHSPRGFNSQTYHDSSTEPDEEMALCNCGISNKNRIIGGVDTKPHEFPWQVGLVYPHNPKPFCGGSIITSQHILTAAHCTAGSKPSDMNVLLGEHDINHSTAEIHRIIEINDHPDYNKNKNMHFDISILTMDYRIIFNQRMRPVCLPYDSSYTYTKRKAKVTGWGLLVEGGTENDLSSVLQKVDLTVLENSDCYRKYGGSIGR